MKNFLLASLFIVFSCNHRELCTNPLIPNYGATLDDLENWGFKLTTADDGFCVYSKSIGKINVDFELSSQDECRTIKAQHFRIQIDTLRFWTATDSADYMSNKNHLNFADDSAKVVKLISQFGGHISSSIRQRPGNLGPLFFDVENDRTKEIFDCELSIFPERIKGLTITAALDTATAHNNMHTQ